ncbi:molecular chaperone HtpG [Bernardetia sp.]|uniref:molecular chaperone HtpG n=1 Tax=Bernardetia sp. TaxID=1937974 RepID=UPI0025BB4D34|nr:molecular chaperone HtpG [Bernardetia sp.]
MSVEQGNLSVNTENIFPIIKKFLYSDHEIFLRELVANAVDATQKLKHLSSSADFEKTATSEVGELKVKVSFDKEAKTITVSDNGIGMTADEIKKYINQIAFSGATEFVEKYKDAPNNKQIIGHFGLGFYSAFMVSKKVEIISRSFSAKENEAAHWECEGSTSFELEQTTKAERGTDIILHVAEDSEEFLESFRLKGILDKYAKFLPMPIEFEGEQINDPNPLWTKQPSDLKDEDYLEFYKKLYPYGEDPLFWIHLNVDYPFELTGILYFPKVKQELTASKDKIQLYSRQVFITDEVKEIVPEFLTLLHGVIDSPDIPLNVSRSYLQADGNVKRISSYITKKVADKLQELFKNDREGYEKKWDDIGLFVKFGMITDEKFLEKAEKFALVKSIEGKYYTFDEYNEKIAANQTDKDGKKVWLYAADVQKQHTFISSAQKRGYDVLVMDSIIDSHLIQRLEAKLENVSLRRIDSDTADKIIAKDEKMEAVLSEADQTKVKEVFEKIVSANHTVEVQPMPTDEMPVTLTLSEFMRRMKEMAMSGGGGMYGMNLPDQYNVIVNANHSLVQKILDTKEEEAQQQIARQAYDLALLSQNLLEGQALSSFVERSLEFMK